MIQLISIIINGLLSTGLPPRPHAFVEADYRTSMIYGVSTLGIVAMILTCLACVINSNFALDMLFQTSGISVATLTGFIEPIISAMVSLNNTLASGLNASGFSYTALTEMHTNLTPYIINCQYLIHLLGNSIYNFQGSAQLYLLQDLFTRLSDAFRILLSNYRLIENILGIALANSPIPA